MKFLGRSCGLRSQCIRRSTQDFSKALIAPACVTNCPKRGLRVDVDLVLPLKYDGVTIDVGYRLDLLVEDAMIVELKTVRKLLPVHQAQLLSYLRLSKRRLGLLIDFNVYRLLDGVKRMVV